MGAPHQTEVWVHPIRLRCGCTPIGLRCGCTPIGLRCGCTARRTEVWVRRPSDRGVGAPPVRPRCGCAPATLCSRMPRGVCTRNWERATNKISCWRRVNQMHFATVFVDLLPFPLKTLQPFYAHLCQRRIRRLLVKGPETRRRGSNTTSCL